MRKLIFSLLFAAPMLALAGGEPIKLEFYDGDISKIQETARTAGKLYFYHFDAEWCEPCTQMREKTFTDEMLASYVADNYIAVRMDIDNFDGFAVKERLKVQKMPAIIIFGQDGRELERREEMVDAESLLNLLKKWRSVREATPVTTAKPAATTKPAAAVSKATDTAKEDLTPAPAVGFAIQMLILSDREQALKTRDALRKTHPDQPVFILDVDGGNGKKTYRILLGDFPTKARAEQYRKSKAPKGIVKDLSTL